MPTVDTSLQDLQAFLEKFFQFENADLDFGIRRGPAQLTTQGDYSFLGQKSKTSDLDNLMTKTSKSGGTI